MYLVVSHDVELPFEIANFALILGNPNKVYSDSLLCIVEVEN